MRRFAGLSLTRGSMPDEATILNFRHLLEKNSLAARLLTEVNALLSERGLGSNVTWHVAMNRGKRKAILKRPMKNTIERLEKLKASVRARVEHPFRVVKQQFGYARVRYRDLVKNTAQRITLFALSNMWMVRRQLLTSMGEMRSSWAKWLRKG